MDTFSDAAVAKFSSGYNCAQSVLWAVAPRLNLDSEIALKIACGLGAGMGRRQETCGAVTGGILVLGLQFGRGDAQDRTATEATYSKAQELMRRFEVAHGSCNCRQLLGGCDLATEAGRAEFKRQDLFNKVCVSCVGTVCRILEDLFKE